MVENIIIYDIYKIKLTYIIIFDKIKYIEFINIKDKDYCLSWRENGSNVLGLARSNSCSHNNRNTNT